MVKFLVQYFHIQLVYGELEGLLLRNSSVSSDGKNIVSDEGIKLGISDSRVLDTLLENIDGITLESYVVTYLGSLG